MEKKKSNKVLLIILILLIVILGTGVGLLLGGVIKSPFVKEKVCKKCICTKCNVKKEEKKEVKESRYYQFKTEIPDKNGEGVTYKVHEIELKPDGTVKIDFLNVLDTFPKSGVYVENDKYIILALNTSSSYCYEGNYNPEIADGCTDTIILIKDNDVLKTQRGSIYHFEIDNEESELDFREVQKSELLSDLKN